MELLNLSETSAPFLDYLDQWITQLPVSSLEQCMPDPRRSAVLSVDLINGFCYQGPLSSPRVASIVQPITQLLTTAWDYGLRNVVFIQDTHEPAAVEFESWGVHCVRGTAESEAVSELKNLPFYDQTTTFPKNSISSTLNTCLPDWLAEHPEVNNFIVVGDCTDLCTYQLAMELKLEANANQLDKWQVIVPADCTNTYDLPVNTALEANLPPHPGDFFHATFLYHMAMNGVEVVQSISPG